MKHGHITILVAVAFVLKIQQIYKNASNLLQFDAIVAYMGNDVPTKVDVQNLAVSISSTTTLSQMAATTASVIRADATSRGYTINAGNVFLPTFSSN